MEGDSPNLPDITLRQKKDENRPNLPDIPMRQKEDKNDIKVNEVISYLHYQIIFVQIFDSSTKLVHQSYIYLTEGESLSALQSNTGYGYNNVQREILKIV